MTAGWFTFLVLWLWPCVHLEVLPPQLDVRAIREAMTTIFDPPGAAGVYAVLVDPATNLLLVVGNRESVLKAAELLAGFRGAPEETDRPPLHVLYLKFTASRQIVDLIEPAVRDLAGLGPVTLHADGPTNSVIVQGAGADFAAIRSIVQQLDAPAFYPRMTSLPRVLVETLLFLAREDRDAVALYCHGVEGSFCFRVPVERISAYRGEYDAALERAELPRPLSRLLIHALGWKYVEHAHGNGVKLRCRRGAPDRCPDCSWDRGGGWEPLRIVSVRGE